MALAQTTTYPLRVKAALAAAALLSLWGAFEFWNVESERARAGDPFQVAAQFDRFAGFAAAVWAKRPVSFEAGHHSVMPSRQT